MAGTLLVRCHRWQGGWNLFGALALRRIIENHANRDDILAYFEERLLPIDTTESETLADEVLRNPPELGYLTISNALQWRLQYSRVIEQAGTVDGILRLA